MTTTTNNKPENREAPPLRLSRNKDFDRHDRAMTAAGYADRAQRRGEVELAKEHRRVALQLLKQILDQPQENSSHFQLYLSAKSASHLAMENQDYQQAMQLGLRAHQEQLKAQRPAAEEEPEEAEADSETAVTPDRYVPEPQGEAADLLNRGAAGLAEAATERPTVILPAGFLKELATAHRRHGATQLLVEPEDDSPVDWEAMTERVVAALPANASWHRAVLECLQTELLELLYATAATADGATSGDSAAAAAEASTEEATPVAATVPDETGATAAPEE